MIEDKNTKQIKSYQTNCLNLAIVSFLIVAMLTLMLTELKFGHFINIGSHICHLLFFPSILFNI